MSTSKAPASTAPTQAPPELASEDAARRPIGIRRVKMTISKVSPLSVLKIAFLISVAIGVMIVVAMMFLWFILDSMHVFSQIEELLETLNSESLLRLGEYLQFGRWMSFAVIVAIIDMVLLTALAVIGAIAYNLIASLVGGLRITVTDE